MLENDDQNSRGRIGPGSIFGSPAKLTSSFFWFFMGGLGVYLFNKSGGEIVFSPLEIINFSISILLAGVSTGLAFIAIFLGKNSEDRIIDHSRHSEDLQNKLFARNIEILGRIESSSGITEKRVDDIFKDIREITGKNVTKNKEEEIKESIREGLSSVPEDQRRKWRSERAARTREKNKFQKSVLSGIAGLSGVSTIKQGEGTFGGDGDELMDGIFEFNGKKFSVSILFVPQNSTFKDEYSTALLSEYVRDLSTEHYLTGVLKKSFIITNRSEDQSFLEGSIKNITELFKEEIRDSFAGFAGDADNVVQKVKEIIVK